MVKIALEPRPQNNEQKCDENENVFYGLFVIESNMN